MGLETLEERRRGAGGPRPVVMRQGWAAKVQRAWAERSVAERLGVLTVWRHAISGQTEAFCRAVAAGPDRTDADVLVTEILPLLGACEYLEDKAQYVLKQRRLGRSGRPFWLGKVRSEVCRVALGRILVIGPSNYPLFLPGVQVLQALAAGNAVTWKPGRGGREVAKLFASTMTEAGMPRELLRVTEESDEAGIAAVAAGADKVFFTGSAAAGRKVMRALVETATPCVMELSDSSAVIVLPKADLGRVVAAVVFGMRLNGSATCMAPRRLLVMGSTTARREELVRQLQAEFLAVPRVLLGASVSKLLKQLVEEARAQGATVIGELSKSDELGVDQGQGPVLVVGATAEMRLTRTEIFAPVLSVIDVTDTGAIVAAQRACPYALTVSIFGEESAARRLATRIRVGTVVINDLIAPTADPRVPFGGRRASGFGVTRGAEGLLEMTGVKTLLVQRGASRRHYEATSEAHAKLFRGLILAGHAKTWMQRWFGVRQLIMAARKLNAGTKSKYQRTTET